jgi:hypothetical protein
MSWLTDNPMMMAATLRAWYERVGPPEDDGCDPDLHIDIPRPVTIDHGITFSCGHETWCPRYATGDMPGHAGEMWGVVDRFGHVVSLDRDAVPV